MIPIDLSADELTLVVEALEVAATGEHTCKGFVDLSCRPCMSGHLVTALKLKLHRSMAGRGAPRLEFEDVFNRESFSATEVVYCGIDPVAVAQALVALREVGILRRLAPDVYTIPIATDRDLIIKTFQAAQREHDAGLALQDAISRLSYREGGYSF